MASNANANSVEAGPDVVSEPDPYDLNWCPACDGTEWHYNHKNMAISSACGEGVVGYRLYCDMKEGLSDDVGPIDDDFGI